MLQSVVQPLVRGVTDRGSKTAIQRAISLLRRFGSDAHLWLPGVGTINGLSTGNYLESTGNTVLTVDNPAGLVLDALGTVGSELVVNGGFDTDTGWTKGAGWSISGGVASAVAATSNLSKSNVAPSPTGKTYRVTLSVLTLTGGSISPQIGGSIYVITSPGTYTFHLKPTSGDATLYIPGSSFTGTIDNISVREVTGIHLTQATTANKGVLRLTSGRYNWVFDATDLLTGTFPAGYESVTVIDAKSTGQVTTAAANIVGSYSIGPSYTSYGRIVVKGSLTASELTLLQGFANKLAGL